MASPMDSSTIPQLSQSYRDRFFEDSPGPLRSDFESDSDDFESGSDDSDDSDDDDDEPLPSTQMTLSLGTPVPSRGFAPREQTLTRTIPSTQLSQAGDTRPVTSLLPRKRAIAKSAAQNPRIRKRNRGMPPPPSQAGSQRRPPVAWGIREVAQLMLWFLHCTREGFFQAERAGFKKAWQYTLEQAQAMWPEKGLTDSKCIAAKYYAERKKWRELMDLMTSGTSFTEDGLPDVSDAVWERFWAAHPGATRTIATRPIGDHEVYAEVFATERSVGGAIMEPADILSARDQEAQEEINQASDTSGDTPEDGDDEGGDGEAVEGEEDGRGDGDAGEEGRPALPSLAPAPLDSRIKPIVLRKPYKRPVERHKHWEDRHHRPGDRTLRYTEIVGGGTLIAPTAKDVQHHHQLLLGSLIPRSAEALVNPQPTQEGFKDGGSQSTLVADADRRSRASDAKPAAADGADDHGHASSQTGHASSQTQPGSMSDLLCCHDDRQPQMQLHYLDILKDAISCKSYSRIYGGVLQMRASLKPPQLDDVDREFLARKGVFDLPPRHHLDVLLKTYFERVYPYSPIVDRVDFLSKYASGTFSLFLLYAMLATASAAFATRATLLHDLQFESDLLPMLQGSVILGAVIVERPTDKDFHYWLWNASRLAAKMDIYPNATRDLDGTPPAQSRLYRRICWILYCRENCHMIANPRSNLQHPNGDPNIKPITLADWETEESPKEFQSMVQPLTVRQKLSFTARCELAKSLLDTNADLTAAAEPRQGTRLLDAWRMSLAEKLDFRGESPEADIHYAELRALSYRFEATACRQIRRRCLHADFKNDGQAAWARQRLRSAIFELDSITGRMLANGTLHMFPTTCITIMPALLALQIEAALDPSETDVVRSMSRIAIGQTMLVLTQLREVPAIKRAIPVFEAVLSKMKLYSPPNNNNTSLPPAAAAAPGAVSGAFVPAITPAEGKHLAGVLTNAVIAPQSPPPPPPLPQQMVHGGVAGGFGLPPILTPPQDADVPPAVGDYHSSS
ncbi:hypothetical protein B0T26DRAFT_750994 [Lasiosphaeria miniovina]|uniref:Transcription factor domain-containing protein n=1 Tax=Lasiosphaeria miniovina TaxID=1954250 RepID=A0AA40AJE6_9PEZI|nr:uncharacterized protein B0T26DRAFT_750994 [Lasiosphaeria miniovina]KAK0716845.1 hypothetical protein B0T26DRAFT_750994 [Lasiosphaeria miniovina]